MQDQTQKQRNAKGKAVAGPKAIAEVKVHQPRGGDVAWSEERGSKAVENLCALAQIGDQ